MKRFLTFSWLLAAAALTAAEPLAKPAAKPLRPGEYDGNIAFVTGNLLQRYHYLQHELDDEMAGRFFDRYIERFDSQRMLLLESDVKEFESFRTTLDDLVKSMDVSPAHLIFARFLERLEARHTLVMGLLESGGFEFKGDERFLFNRRNAARPKDMEEARQLWRDQLRNEYLAEKLSLEKKPASDAKKQSEPSAATKKAGAASTPPKSVHETIVTRLKKRYGQVHDYFVKRDSDDVLEFYLSALSQAYDPHSDYMGHAENENFNISMRLSLFGIGAQLTDEDGYCTVNKLMPGPAMKSKKVKEKDRIIAVAQGDKEPVDVVGWKLDKVVELIRGPKDSEVRLTIIPADAADVSERKVVSLVRDEIKLEDQEAKAKIIELPAAGGKSARLGVIDLPSFYADFDQKKPEAERKSTTKDVALLINKLKEQKVDGIVLDLRRNGGGSLEDAVKTTGLFIKEGPVVKVRDFRGEEQADADKDPGVLYDGPLIVLTSHFSASASEILAGALQDYGRALVVGDASTHGKGTVQTLMDISNFMRGQGQKLPFDPGSIKLTIRKFYLPSGASTQLKGVVPDIVLPSINNYADIGERELNHPLPWDTIQPADFAKQDRVKPYLAELKKLNEARIKTSKDYEYIREDIERYQKLKADKTVSLNEEQRRKELQEATVRVEARKKEMLARQQSENKTYAFTLKDALKPGLPAAGSSTNLASVASGKAAGHGSLQPKADGDEEDSEEAKLPDVDAPLNEAVQILLDYIGLLSKERAVAVKN